MNNVLTASRMSTLMRCPRQHFWQNEIGLRNVANTGLALRIGSAWARAMEARWNGADYDKALATAIPEGIDLDAYTCETIAALLAGYYDRWGSHEEAGKIHPEVHFGPNELPGTDFVLDGKIDGLGSLSDGRSVLYEGKTTGSDIGPDSQYWLRLRFNMQVLQYVVEARNLGWDLSAVYYDVVRKPSIKPKLVNDLDSDGAKIVLDDNGDRVFGKKGEPRQTADKAKGYVVKQHVETPAEFGERVWMDTRERHEFYFVRREIPILDQDCEMFERQRRSLARLISHYREEECGGDGEPEEVAPRDPEAWPRNVSTDTCKFCSYQTFCLQNLSVDLNHPPAGFEVMPFNPELNECDSSAQSEDNTPASS